MSTLPIFFQEMTDLNHGLLRTLGVSHDAIETVLGILRRFGFKGKLTGAGGGGSVFTLIKPGRCGLKFAATFL